MHPLPCRKRCSRSRALTARWITAAATPEDLRGSGSQAVPGRRKAPEEPARNSSRGEAARPLDRSTDRVDRASSGSARSAETPGTLRRAGGAVLNRSEVLLGYADNRVSAHQQGIPVRRGTSVMNQTFWVGPRSRRTRRTPSLHPVRQPGAPRCAARAAPTSRSPRGWESFTGEDPVRFGDNARASTANGGTRTRRSSSSVEGVDSVMTRNARPVRGGTCGAGGVLSAVRGGSVRHAGRRACCHVILYLYGAEDAPMKRRGTGVNTEHYVKFFPTPVYSRPLRRRC